MRGCERDGTAARFATWWVRKRATVVFVSVALGLRVSPGLDARLQACAVDDDEAQEERRQCRNWPDHVRAIDAQGRDLDPSTDARVSLRPVKIRAAVLEDFGQPLVVQEPTWQSPGTVRCRAPRRVRRVSHRSLHGLRRRPDRIRTVRARARGGRNRRAYWAGCTLVAPGDQVITLFAPGECGQCVHCRSGRTNRCTAIREMQGQGYLPDGLRASRDGEPMRHFMGTSTFAEYTVMPEIALAKVSPEASLEGRAPFACGLSTGIGAALYTADVQPGSTRCSVAVSSGSAPSSAAGSPAPSGSSRSTSRRDASRRPSPRRHRHPRRGRGHRRLDPRGDGGFGADYTFEATGNVRVMQQAVEAAREAWGLATMVGVAGKGETLDIVPRLLITGRRVTGSSFGGVKGRTQVPLLVDRWLAGEIDVEALLSHRLSLDEVNHGFDLMEEQDGIRSVITFA